MKNIKLWSVSGLVFTALLGTLAHFFYDWSGENPLIGLVCPVNESTWEHMKLIFFPVVVWSLFLPCVLMEEYPALRPALLAGGISGTLAVPVLFYTYSGVLGRNVAWVDIGIFYISVMIAFLLTWKLKDSEKTYEKRAAVYLMTALLIVLFFLFTCTPPDIGLFAEP